MSGDGAGGDGGDGAADGDSGVSDTGGGYDTVYSTSVAESVIIDWEVTNLPPKTVFYPYINNTLVSSYTKPANGAFGDTIRTDVYGDATGTMVVPSDTVTNFTSGTLQIQFGDNPNTFRYSKAFATASFQVRSSTEGLRGFQSLSSAADSNSADLNIVGRRTVGSANTIDPMAQTFVIDGSLYPKGVFISALDLFFYTKSNEKPVLVEIRPTSSGKPVTSGYIKGSLVKKLPTSINVPAIPSAGLGPATKFGFDFPVYLRPGIYAICITTDSSEYSLYSSTYNSIKYNSTNKVGRLPYVENLYNYNDYINPDLNTDICFTLYKSKFTTGTAVFELSSRTGTDIGTYNSLKFNGAASEFSDSSLVSYALKTRNTSNTFSTSYTSIESNYENILEEMKNSLSAGDILVQGTFTNTDSNLSPVVDLETVNATVTKRTVSGSSALSSYISKMITVEDGKEFSGVSVEMLINKPAGVVPTGTNPVKVYVKVLTPGDTDIDSKAWIELSRKDDISLLDVTGPDDFTKDIYQKFNITYGTANFSRFNKLKVKINLYATSPAKVPYISKIITRTV